MGEERAPEIGDAIRPEPELHARQAQRPLRVSLPREHGCAEPVGPLDDEPGVHGVAALLRLAQARAQSLLAVSSPALLRELGMPLEVGVHIVRWQERQDRETRRGDAEREPHALRQHERPDREAALLAQEAHRLITPTHRQERALLRPHREGAHDVARDGRDVVAGCRHLAHQVELGAGHPSTRPLVLIDESLVAERHQKPVGRGPREIGSAREVAHREAVGGGLRDEAEQPRGARDRLRSGDRRGRVHDMDDRRLGFHMATPAVTPGSGERSMELQTHEREGAHVIDKTWGSAAEAVADIPDGASLAVGGFGLSGNPIALIEALLAQGTSDLSIVSNNCGVDDWGLGILLGAKRIRKMTSSYVGENKEFERQFLTGELELELTPQGTLAEKLRAGGSGVAAFYTQTGVGTQVAESGLPRRYSPDGSVAVASPVKDVRTFDVSGEPREYVLEEAIVTDFALVHAWKGDRHGNLVFNKAARNFNPLAAMAGRTCIAQVEELVEPGELDPDGIHLPGIYVHRIVEVGTDIEKRIERRTVKEA